MKYLISFFIICLFGCTTQPKDGEIITENIFCKQINISSLIGLPIQLVASNTVLYINDFYGDTLIHCISLKDGSLLNKLGIKGNGPGEVIAPIHLFTQKDSLYVFIRNQWNLSHTSMNPGDGKLIKDFTPPFEVSLLFPIGDSNYLASGMFDKDRFHLYDYQGNEQYSFGDYPQLWNAEKEFSTDVKRMFHQVRGFHYSKEKGLAITDSHVLSLYSRKNPDSKFILNKEILLAPYEYNYKDATTSMSSTTTLKPTAIKGAIELTATDESIYVLFDPNSKEKDKQKRINNEIWIFDWEGNMKKKLMSDVDLSLFTMTPNHRIVAITNDEEPKMVIMDL